ncbi:MAG TPA: DUF86 domain-containing protein [Candidatus Gastranaerophilaceae bacterium]|nr:DUF86 domain-containing protein [Candidatus Gastranaerophilaceae bacterium]HPT41568.1 DUF86 domain-containing protein [Candidatus Gastranaerophilaceae bacterium]
MKQRNPLFYLKDIQTSVNKILKYTENMSFEVFKKDEKTIDAVERNFEIIGEAVKNLSEEIKSKYPDVPFKQIAGMRDKLIHDYFGVDYEIIYKTIKDKIPEFKFKIEKIIKSINKN